MPARKLFLNRQVLLSAGAVLLSGFVLQGPLAASGNQGGGRSAPAQAVGPGRPADGHSFLFAWWNDKEIQKELGLDPPKVAKLERVYQQRSAELRPNWERLRDEGKKLDELTRARTVDVSEYQIQVMRVTNLRARFEEDRAVLQYRSYRELRPEQYQKLRDILDRRMRDSRDRATSNSPGKSGNQ